MPELTAVHFGLLTAMLVIGAVLGWIFRSDRCAKEKIAVNAGWQKELEYKQTEHDRLAGQNKSLMEQINQFQSSQKDYSNRARELSESLKESFSQRDQLQRQIKDIRGSLDVAIAQRDRVQDSLQRQQSSSQAASIKDKDDKIFRLSRELTSWQIRVPPLVERFQSQSQKAQELTEELEKANARIAKLEELTDFSQTRIEPMDADALPDGGDASNEPNAMTATHDTSDLRDNAGDEAEVAEDALAESGDDARTDVDDTGDASNEDEPVSDDSDDEDDDEDEPDSRDTDDEDDPGSDDTNNEDDDNELSSGDTDGEHDEDESGSDDTDDEDDAPDVGEVGESDEDESADNLKMIKGIGPSIEKTLNDLGICRFQQIADMSEFEIDRVAQQLRGFRSRIYREDWIGQARDLHYDKSNQRF